MAPTSYSRKVDALIPRGEGINLPDALADAWQDQGEHFESPSSIVRFLDCPLQWFAERHLERLHKQTGETILGITNFERPLPNHYAVGGTLSHRVLEVFYSEPREYRTEDVLEQTFDHAWDRLTAGDLKDGIIGKDLLREFDLVVENADRSPKAFKAMFRKTYFDITMAIFDMENPPRVNVVGNESWIRVKRDKMTVRGKIDRVDLNARGLEIIVDYKTGKSPAGDISVFNKTFLPSGIYALSREEEFAGTPEAREIAGVKLMYLKEPRQCAIRTTDEVLDDVSEIVEMVADQMAEIGETGHVPAVKKASKNDQPCRFCPLRDFCPVVN